jgi:hypothetical protein
MWMIMKKNVRTFRSLGVFPSDVKLTHIYFHFVQKILEIICNITKGAEFLLCCIYRRDLFADVLRGFMQTFRAGWNSDRGPTRIQGYSFLILTGVSANLGLLVLSVLIPGIPKYTEVGHDHFTII